MQEVETGALNGMSLPSGGPNNRAHSPELSKARLGILRESIWPDATPLQTKLFGDKVELEKTIRFIRVSKIKI